MAQAMEPSHSRPEVGGLNRYIGVVLLPPGHPEGGAFQESTASAPNQTVMSLRRCSDSSYAPQFGTRYLVFYFGVTLLFVRAAIFVVSRGLASESTVGLGGPEVQRAEPCTHAGPSPPADLVR